MQVTILQEAGHELALMGMAYSFRDRADIAPAQWFQAKAERAHQRAPKLAPMDGGHNKFLESIQVWIDVEASRAFWSEFDTYRAGVTKQSESTMHTLSKRAPILADFEKDTPANMVAAFIEYWEHWKTTGGANIAELKCALPEGFLQRRIVCTNYKALRNILAQRKTHRLKYWPQFCATILEQCKHPEYFADICKLEDFTK